MREEQIQEAPVKVLLVGVDLGEQPKIKKKITSSFITTF